MIQPDVPVTHPVRLAPETWLIPNLAAADPGTYVPVNSMLIRGREPVIVDTGAPIHREHWLEQVFSLVEPEDVRWVFLSHDDGDHESTGVLWAVDSFAALTTGAVHHLDDLPPDLYDETFSLFNSLISPWHEWLDTEKYGRHVDSVAALRPEVVASAHGPVLTGTQIEDAFDRVRALAGTPRLMGPDQATLDELVAAATAA